VAVGVEVGVRLGVGVVVWVGLGVIVTAGVAEGVIWADCLLLAAMGVMLLLTSSTGDPQAINRLNPKRNKQINRCDSMTILLLADE
jgi:hypothetical protein